MPPPTSGEAKLSVDVLRRELDAAIVAEAGDAVKVIRERIVEAEGGRGERDAVRGRAAVLEQSPVAKTPSDDRSLPSADDHLAMAVRLAAEAGEWGVVAMLARQLDALRRERGGGELRVIDGGADAAGSGEP